MSDTEKPKKRQMTPEARERMLANLKKGREAKAKKLAEAKKAKMNGTTSTHPEPERENDERKDTLGGEKEPALAPMKLTCHGCKKVFKHSSSKSKHLKICKVLNPPIPAPEPQQTPSPILQPQPQPDLTPVRRRRRKQKVTIVESDSESSSSSSEEELVVHKKRKKKKNVVIRDTAPSPPPPLVRQPPKPVAPQLSPQEIAARREQAMILHMARSMGNGGLQ